MNVTKNVIQQYKFKEQPCPEVLMCLNFKLIDDFKLFLSQVYN